MSLYPPKPIFSDAEKRLLALLAKLLIEAPKEGKLDTNIPEGEIALSDAEAAELAENLHQLVNSRSFIEASFFAEAVTDPAKSEQAKELYLSARKKRGRSRVLSSNQWADFQTRLGIDIPPYRIIPTQPMSLGYFKKMEMSLLKAAGLSPRVISILMGVIDQQEQALEDIRKNKLALQHGIVKAAVVDPVLGWLKKPHALTNKTMSREKIGGIMTVVADTTVMFTTRDWGVAGTLSTIAGALAASMIE
ncbi:hypothetical protein ACQVP2_33800 [Methylobacterium aquaticum]|uniref:hypothetical protein n=1 Tax=Methylobacterium aquaticum TaxID=270351 RepID=UPI003D162E3A